MATRKPSQREVGLRHGFRSGLEEALCSQLSEQGLPVHYEKVKIPFVQPEKRRTYCLDFILPNGIAIESKGRFKTEDRQKHLWLKAQYPQLDLRFVFSSSRSRISKTSKTTYANWCETHGFLYADKRIPSAWLAEAVNRASLSLLTDLGFSP